MTRCEAPARAHPALEALGKGGGAPLPALVNVPRVEAPP